MIYPVDKFDALERERLRPHFTNLDRPVFGLMNLPDTIKGAMFARYSRYPGTLRRLFLDEFAEDIPAASPDYDGHEGGRAAALYDRVFVGYGDDSVAQLGGAHVACEYVSNVLTKVLERPRLAAYLEQSTRYIAYDAKLPGSGFRYYRDKELGPGYEEAMDALFKTYADTLPLAERWAHSQFPRAQSETPAAHSRAVRAKALDLVRGLLPAASLSHVGIFATGQTYEQLILHLVGHPLPEARAYGRMILDAVKAVIPSFVQRVERPDRGGEWVTYLRKREAVAGARAARLGLRESELEHHGPRVALVRVDGTEDDALAALLFESSTVDDGTLRQRIAGLHHHERAELFAALIGDRRNRRHRPGRGLELLRYRFEIVSDYGAFRDLQRHRMLTIQWQALSPHNGAEVPEELDEMGAGDAFRRALARSEQAYHDLVSRGFGPAATYALCLAFRIRYVLDMNAREAMHVIELRSGREGHPSYRAIALEMHRHISAVHPLVANAMSYVDSSSEPRLERIISELRADSGRRGPSHDQN